MAKPKIIRLHLTSYLDSLTLCGKQERNGVSLHFLRPEDREGFPEAYICKACLRREV